MKVNSSKTKIIWIGSKKISNQVFHHSRWKLDWGSTTFNLLGICFSVDLEQITDLNYSMQIPKIKSMIQHWNRRILTPIGRVTVVKSLIIPKINHLFISLPTPRRETILSLNKDIFEFVWNAKCDKIKRSVITQDYQQGGLKMLEMNKFIMSLKCSWLKRLIKGKKSWIDIFEAINGVQIVNKLLDFGDAFVSECVIQKIMFFGKMFSILFSVL